MTIYDKIRDEKHQYQIRRKVENTSALLSGKTDQNEYLTGEKVFPSNPRQTIK